MPVVKGADQGRRGMCGFKKMGILKQRRHGKPCCCLAEPAEGCGSEHHHA